MKVYFSHGKESGPWGSKITRLAEIAQAQGYAVDSIDYTGVMDPDQRVEMLVAILKEEERDVLLVGSSMGGYTSLVASQNTELKEKGLFLLAPALYMSSYKVQDYATKNTQIEIVHGWSDDIIPPENSIRFSKTNDSSLHLISGDHRLNFSMPRVEPIFKNFLLQFS